MYHRSSIEIKYAYKITNVNLETLDRNINIVTCTRQRPFINNQFLFYSEIAIKLLIKN